MQQTLQSSVSDPQPGETAVVESFRMLKPDLAPCRIVLIPRRKLMKYNRIRTTLELAGLLAAAQVITPERAAAPHGC